MGGIFGVLAANILEGDQKADLLNYVNQGLHDGNSLENNIYTRQTIISNIQTVFFLFFMGISVIGVPLALLLIFTRGFVLGFSIGFLFQTMGVKGILLSLTGIIPHNLLLIPGLLLMAVAIIDCAAALTKIRFTKRPVPLSQELVKCAALTLVVLVVVVLAALIQGFATPVLTGWVANLL
jgi:stage II sporulation protein M